MSDGNAELSLSMRDCDKTLSAVNTLVWDFPAMKRRPFGDDWTPPGWSVEQEDEPFSTNTTAMAATLHAVAQCIVNVGRALKK